MSPAYDDAPRADHDEVRAQVAAACRKLAAGGLVKGTAGNISVRVNGGVAITATGLVLADATPEDVVVTDDTGRLVLGALAPSSELGLHLEAYREDAVGAVVHTHASASVALSLVTDRLPCIHYQQLVLGGEVPIVPFAVFGSRGLAALAGDALATSNAVILAHHGAVTTGADLDAALTNTDLLEWVSDMYLRALAVGTPRELSPQQQIDVISAVTETGYGSTRSA